MLTNTVEHYTPSVDQLQPFQQITCSQLECGKIFSNQSNYQMHLEKHHRLQMTMEPESEDLQKSSCLRLYYCPGNNCSYWYGKEKGKHFKNMKLLRQHYQKVHMAKRYECSDCTKAFTTEGQLRKHKLEVCGKAFACRDCGWTYDSMEALQTHGKRKGHSIKDFIILEKKVEKREMKIDEEINVKEEKMQEEVPEKDNKQEMSVQTVDIQEDNNVTSLPRSPVGSSQMSAGVQTDFFPEMQVSATNHDLSHALEEIHSLLRDIETQTEPLPFSSDNGHNYLDQMLAQSHMYTQTCDDFLSELGLADIQTQTHWPSPQRTDEQEEEVEKLQYTSTATSTNACIHDELLVSTETQTSFTQCLLNSCSDAGTVAPPPPVSFGGLCHTQHTQTCGEPLLESFDFGGQASDLMDGFQSAYTQT